MKFGQKHVTAIGYFVVREAEGTCEIEVQDAPPMDTREDAERWIEEKGTPGVDYWICWPIHSRSMVRE